MRRRHSAIPQIWITIIFLAAVMLSRILPHGGLSPKSGNSPAPSVETGTQISGKCVGVSDGDTIRIMHRGREEKIRLFGVDAPEMSQPYGNAAKRFTSQMVFGKTVTVDVRTQDRYGRTVGWVKTEDGRLLDVELVRAGLAWWYQYYDPDDQKLAKLEASARKAKRGLWQQSNSIPPWEYRRVERTR